MRTLMWTNTSTRLMNKSFCECFPHCFRALFVFQFYQVLQSYAFMVRWFILASSYSYYWAEINPD